MGISWNEIDLGKLRLVGYYNIVINCCWPKTKNGSYSSSHFYSSFARFPFRASLSHFIQPLVSLDKALSFSFPQKCRVAIYALFLTTTDPIWRFCMYNYCSIFCLVIGLQHFVGPVRIFYWAKVDHSKKYFKQNYKGYFINSVLLLLWKCEIAALLKFNILHSSITIFYYVLE